MEQEIAGGGEYRMGTKTNRAQECGALPTIDSFDPGVVELQLLLPSGEAVGLETAAHERGLTAAQLIRRLLRGFLNRGAAHPPQ